VRIEFPEEGDEEEEEVAEDVRPECGYSRWIQHCHMKNGRSQLARDCGVLSQSNIEQTTHYGT